MTAQKRRYVLLSVFLFLLGCLGGFIAGRPGTVIEVRPRRWVLSLLYSLGGGILTLAGAFSLAWLYKRA